MRSVLFVCLGNICRSPLAEGAARAALQRAGIAVRVDSAGTGNWHVGRPPDPRAQAVARANGIDISALRARQICPGDYARFDLMLTADQANLRDVRAIVPYDQAARVVMMLDMVPGRTGQAVADPYHGHSADFVKCWHDVTAVADALVRKYQRRADTLRHD